MNQLDFASPEYRNAGLGQTELRLQYLNSADNDSNPEKVHAAARELETYFLHVLIREMRKTVPPNPLIHGGKAEEIFQDFFDEEMAIELSRSNQFGLADSIYESLQNVLKQKPTYADI